MPPETLLIHFWSGSHLGHFWFCASSEVAAIWEVVDLFMFEVAAAWEKDKTTINHNLVCSGPLFLVLILSGQCARIWFAEYQVVLQSISLYLAVPDMIRKLHRANNCQTHISRIPKSNQPCIKLTRNVSGMNKWCPLSAIFLPLRVVDLNQLFMHLLFAQRFPTISNYSQRCAMNLKDSCAAVWCNDFQRFPTDQTPLSQTWLI